MNKEIKKIYTVGNHVWKEIKKPRDKIEEIVSLHHDVISENEVHLNSCMWSLCNDLEAYHKAEMKRVLEGLKSTSRFDGHYDFNNKIDQAIKELEEK